jgi:CTP:molybdopterin cytidylyltransferase MocA
MSSSRFAAVILSAGYASRMKRFKPLLPLNGLTAVERVVSMFKSFRQIDIFVVIGCQAETMRPALEPLGVHTVINRDFEQGMFSSVMTGLKTVDRSCRAFFVQPVDIPLVRPATIGALIKRFTETQEKICYPVFMGQRGHPPLISTDLVDEILAWGGHMGLRGFLETRESDAGNVPVPDEGILLDMDTPGDYDAVLSGLENEEIPTEAEQRMMTAIQQLPMDVIRHCRAVAAVAQAIADALLTAGVRVDTRLVYAAALVHDIAIKEKAHAAAGADLLLGWGFPKVADIVRAHMDITANDAGPVTEAEIVHLADKFIVGHRLVSLEDRFARKLRQYGRNPAVADAIEYRRETALRIQSKIEKITGRSVSDMVKDNIRNEESPF